MKTFNVALIGIGNWGSILKRYFEADGRFFLKHICDSKSDLNKVFKNSDIDVVAVATPDETHADLVLTALEHNKHVFCEKPLTLKYPLALEIKRLAREKEKVVLTNYIYTFSKAMKKIQELVGSKEIGELEYVSLASRQPGRLDQNVYWVLGSHMLSVLDMFVPIEACSFKVEEFTNYHQTVISKSIFTDKLDIEISLNCRKKERWMRFDCDKAMIFFYPMEGKIKVVYNKKYEKDDIFFEYDESQNIALSLDYLYDCLMGKSEDNLDRACLITKVINKLEIQNGGR